jgi:hypothetical protein
MFKRLFKKHRQKSQIKTSNSFYIEPIDTFVLQFKGILDGEMREKILKDFQKQLKSDSAVIILDSAVEPMKVEISLNPAVIKKSN